jgi:hypothetical protein
LQALLRGVFKQTSDMAIVVSTLLIVALSLPLRTRIQAEIDRRFYRRKFDAARTLAAFAATLGSEVDLNQICDDLVKVVQETMQPAHISLQLFQPDWGDRRSTELAPQAPAVGSGEDGGGGR